MKPRTRRSTLASAITLPVLGALAVYGAGFIHALAWSEVARGAARGVARVLVMFLPAGSSGWGFDGPFRALPSPRPPVPPGDPACFVIASQRPSPFGPGRLEIALLASGGEWLRLLAIHAAIVLLVIASVRSLGRRAHRTRPRTGADEFRYVGAVFAVSGAISGLWLFLAQFMFFVWIKFEDLHLSMVQNLGNPVALGPFGAGSLAIAAAMCDAMTIVTITSALARGAKKSPLRQPTGYGATVPPRFSSCAPHWLTLGWTASLLLYAGPLALAWANRVLPSDLSIQRYVPY